jgi:CRP/FNR family cyclic AMP-dependent transcriptional regulator
MDRARFELLQAMPIFGGVSDATLDFLLSNARAVAVKGGDFFFREGEAPTGVYILEKGRVAVCRKWKGRDVIMRYLSQGDCFGEMALMDLQTRSASIRATVDCQAIELRPDALYRLYERDLEQFALIQMNMGREVCRRLRQADEVIFRTRMESAPDSDDTIIRTG